MNDQSAAELKANLQAKREWLTTASKRDLRYRRVKREVHELEAELAALGDMLEAPKPRRSEAPRRKIYHATHRIQMQTVDWPAPGEIDEDGPLCFHEDRGDGMPACGQPLRTWTDFKTDTMYPTYWLRFGAGPVDCGKCANVTGAVLGYEPLAEPQGDSVRTVPGGAFEMNRRRH
jgi:hypothetical protein